MKKNILWIVTGLVLLATACKENDTVKPVSAASVHYAPVRSTQQPDSLYTLEGEVSPVKVKWVPSRRLKEEEVDLTPVLR